MADWRVARSIMVLFGQLNTLYPLRSKASDGTIGDASHTYPSDHLPDAYGVVRAGDYTHDPAHGADMGRISEEIRVSHDPRVKYVIFNRRIFSATISPWVWRTYTGTNPHSGHMHLSVVSSDVADAEYPWQIGGSANMTPQEWLNTQIAGTSDTPGRVVAQWGKDLWVGVHVRGPNFEADTRDRLRALTAGMTNLLDRPPIPSVDPQAVADALAANPSFVGAIATAVAARVGMIPTAQQIAQQVGELTWHGRVQ